MPLTPHTEHHFTAGESVRDIVIGMSDGLTVPFALAAGLTGAVASTGIIVTAGLAEIAAGSIAMGLGGYLAARSDADHYASERRREEREIVEKVEAEREEVAEVFRGYGLAGAYIAGGLVPLAPYMMLRHDVSGALAASLAVTLLALLVFGGVKGRFTGAHPLKSGLQTMLVGGLAAAAAYGLARLFGGA